MDEKRALGLDVSWWQDDNTTPRKVNFDKAKLNGAEFVFIKASQQVADEDFKDNWKAAKAAGLLRGAYHYLDFRKSEMDQAKLFVSQMGGDWGELPPVVDFEQTPSQLVPPLIMSAALMRGKLWNFLQYVEAQTGKIPMIYVGFYFWREFGNTNVEWAKYPLWLPWYNSETWIKICTKGGTGAPLPWTKWTFWQFTDRLDGIAFGCESKQVDGNYYNGTVDDLRAWVKPTPVVRCPTCGQIIGA